jgi:hypothetical protein
MVFFRLSFALFRLSFDLFRMPKGAKGWTSKNINWLIYRHLIVFDLSHSVPLFEKWNKLFALLQGDKSTNRYFNLFAVTPNWLSFAAAGLLNHIFEASTGGVFRKSAYSCSTVIKLSVGMVSVLPFHRICVFICPNLISTVS